MPYTVLIISGFLAALLVFSWPFLKLVLAGPKDRFRPKDVYFLVFSSIVVLAVVTCFGLYAYVYTSVEGEMDDQVKELASEIKTNFNEELTHALQQLDTLSKNGEIIKQLKSEDPKSKTVGQPKPQAKPVQKAHAGKTDIYQQSETNKTDILPDILKSPSTTYKYFDSVAWIDTSGMQKAKWSVKSYTTQYISVSGRGYFDNIRKGRFYELGDHKFWLESVISKNTGRNQVEISMAIPREPWIVSFDMRLLSLMDPVLPAGYGYAIIANDGKVLFHSDEAHHLGENLFQECDENPELLAGLVGHNDKALTVRYLGEDHSFFITPMKGFSDWSLVTFRNKQPLRSVFLELFTSVAILFLIYGLVVMTLFTMFYIFNVVNERRALALALRGKSRDLLTINFCFARSITGFPGPCGSAAWTEACLVNRRHWFVQWLRLFRQLALGLGVSIREIRFTFAQLLQALQSALRGEREPASFACCDTAGRCILQICL